MNAVFDILAMNALGAACVGVAVFLITRVWRNPHAGSVLWLVVLLKLLVPPIVHIPLPIGFSPPEEAVLPSRGPLAARATEHASSRGRDSDAERQTIQPPPSEATTQLPSQRESAIESAISSRKASPSRVMSSEAMIERSATSAPEPISSQDKEAKAFLSRIDWKAWCVLLWGGVSAALSLLVVRRVFRFGRAVRNLLPASAPLQLLARDLSDVFSLDTEIDVRVTAARTSPFVWATRWGKATIVLPNELATRWETPEIRTVLAHELAHLRRRDHWVRWLELLVTVLYWWHPFTWLARRELRRCQDSCCDLLVLRVLPQSEKDYAEAVFKTVQLFCPTSGLPLMASRFGTKPPLKRRIEMILSQRSRRFLVRKFQAPLLLVAVGLLAFSAALGEKDGDDSVASVPESQAAPSAPPEDAKDETATPNRNAPAYAGGGYATARRPIASSMDFSKDGSKLVGACGDGVIRIWDVRLGYPIRLLKGQEVSANAVVVTPDNKSIISASYRGELITWDFTSGKIVRRVRLQDAQEKTLTPKFSEDARRLVTHGRDRRVIYVWDVATGRLDRRVELPGPGAFLWKSLTRDGRHVAAIAVPREKTNSHLDLSYLELRYWDAETGEVQFTREMSISGGTSLALSPDTNQIAVTTPAGIKILDPQTKQSVQEIIGRPRVVNVMSFSPDGRILAAGGRGSEVKEVTGSRWRRRTNSEIQTWDVESGRRLVFDGSIDGRTVWSLAISDDNRYLAHCDDQRIVIQDIRGRDQVSVIPMHPATELPPAEISRTTELVHILTDEQGAAKAEQWLAIIRELKQIGEPAVPVLADALDRTEDGSKLRILGFALRALDDPAAVPALIRAIPKTLQPPSSDMGLNVDDYELERFAQEHDLGEGYRDGFGLGRPVREIGGALTAITGVSHKEGELYTVSLRGGPRQRRLQREFYQRVADRWQHWWNENWREYLDDPVRAGVGGDGTIARPESPTGRGARIRRISHVTIPPTTEPEGEAFLDLDTGRRTTLPQELSAEKENATLSAEVLAWAKREGLDIIGTTCQGNESGEDFTCLRGVGLRAWEMPNDRWDSLRESLRRGQRLPLDRPVTGEYLVHHDESGRPDPAAPALFLFATSDGTKGAIRIEPTSIDPGATDTQASRARGAKSLGVTIEFSFLSQDDHYMPSQ